MIAVVCDQLLHAAAEKHCMNEYAYFICVCEDLSVCIEYAYNNILYYLYIYIYFLLGAGSWELGAMNRSYVY